MRKHSIAFIGAGMICQVAHLPFYLSKNEIEIKAVCDDRPSNKKYLREFFGIANIHDNYEEILKNKEIDTIVIIAPRKTNTKLIFEALINGKNVISEKPAAYSLRQLKKLLEVRKITNKQFHIGFMKRYDVGIQKLKSKLEYLFQTEEMGKLLSSHFYNYSNSYAKEIPSHQKAIEKRSKRFPMWKPSPDWMPEEFINQFDWFQNVASHDINLLNFLFNDHLSFKKAMFVKDHYLKSFFSFNNVEVTFQLMSSTPKKWVQGGEFIFEKGSLIFKIPSPMNKIKLTHFEIKIKGEQIKTYNFTGGWPFQEQANAFINSLVYGAKSLNLAENSLTDLKLTELIWKDIIKQNKP